MTVPYPVGISLGDNQNTFATLSDSGFAQFEQMASFGITTVRVVVGYSSPAPTSADPVISAALAAGLNVLIILAYYQTTLTVLQFTTFTTAVVNLYAPLGVHWYEVLNEVNQYKNWDLAGHTVSPSGYTTLLQSVYPAIKAADSGSTVLFTSLAPSGDSSSALSPITYLTQAYTAGVQGYFDALGMHPYSWPAYPTDPGATWNAFFQMAGTSPSLRSVMIANGDTAKKIWITEYGAPTGAEGGINPNPNAAYPAGTYLFQAKCHSVAFATLAAAGWNSWVGAFYAFQWADSPSDGDFGIVTANFTPKPALGAFVAGAGTSTRFATSGGSRYRRSS